MSEMISLNLKEYEKPEMTPGLQAEIDAGFRKESFWNKRIPSRLKEKVAVGLAVGMSLMGPMAAEARSGDVKPKEETTVSSSTEREWPEAHWSFFVRGNDGRPQFNPYALIFPGQLEFESKTTQKEKAVFELPYEYSRLFDTGKALNPEDHEKIAQYIDQKLKQEFADKLQGFDKDVYRTHHPEESVPDKVRVTEISITGSASPEGPQVKGPDILAPGNVDDENLNLAMKRAEVGMGLTDEGLKKLGITLDQLEKSAKMMGAKEIQFSDVEMTELANLASGEKGADPLEKIFHLTIKYNDGEIKDPAVSAKLDEIIGSKRKVRITIRYEADQKKVVLIPAPWIIFLPLLKLVKRKKEEEPNLSPEPEPQPKSPEEAGSEPVKPEIPTRIKDTNLQSADSFEYQDMEERAYVDDLYEFFENSDAIRRGLDYAAIADSVYIRYEDFDNDSERENFLAMQILKAWRVHDLEARRDAGVSEENLEIGLDYDNNEDQIKWAKMHAKALLGLILLKRNTANGQNIAYLDLMEPEVQRLIFRRVSRSEGSMPDLDSLHGGTPDEVKPEGITLEEIDRMIEYTQDTKRLSGLTGNDVQYWTEQRRLYLEKQKEDTKFIKEKETSESRAQELRKLLDDLSGLNRELEEKYRVLFHEVTVIDRRPLEEEIKLLEKKRKEIEKKLNKSAKTSKWALESPSNA